MSTRFVDRQDARWAAAAAYIKAQRPKHTAATREEQRRRISEWVAHWMNDEEYRRAMVIACLPGRRYQGRSNK